MNAFRFLLAALCLASCAYAQTQRATNFVATGNVTASTAIIGGTVSGTTGTFSSLTSGRVPFVSTGGLLADSSVFTFSGGTLGVTTLAATGAITGGTITTTATTIPAGDMSIPNAVYVDAAVASNQTSGGFLVKMTNTGSATPADATKHIIGHLGWAADTTGGKTPLFGIEAKLTALGTATEYTGLNSNAAWQGTTFSGKTLYGASITGTSITTDGTTPLAEGTAYGLFIGAITGGATKYAIAVADPIRSTLTTGTAPFVIASSTQVANLNAATAGTASAVAVGGITGLGTGVATALAVNVGSAGAPVVNGGALGTPSSGSGANLTNVVNSATGTSNQVNVSGATGAVTFSLPQSIATTSTPQFESMTLGGSLLGGTGLYIRSSTTTTASQYGINVSPIISSAASTAAYGILARFSANGAFTIGSGYSIYADNPVAAGGVAITNAYGLFINSITAASGTNYALYTNTGLVRFGDVVTASSTVELGHASDTTLSRVSAGVVAIEGVNIVTAATGLTSALAASEANHVFVSGGATRAFVETPVEIDPATGDITGVNDLTVDTLIIATPIGIASGGTGAGTASAAVDALGGATATGTGGLARSTSPNITTSITTPSTTFALLNATATTVNAFGAATTVNTGAAATQIWNFGGSTTASEFRFLEPSGSGTNYSAFKAVAQGANITYSLPPTVGGVNTFLTDVAGNGVLTWGTPAGSGNVTNSGTLTDTAIATGAGTTVVKTPSATSTLDASGNMSLAGDLTVVGADVTIASAGVKMTGSNGSVTFLGLGSGQDEDLKLDLDTTANTATVSSTTGVTTIALGAIGITTTGTNSIGPLVDAVDGTTPLHNIVETVAAGTAYTLTTTYATVDFGTTDPVIVIPNAGTYMVYALFDTTLVSATSTTQVVQGKVRRTNNTAADLGFPSAELLPPGVAASIAGVSVFMVGGKYTTTNTDDSITIQAQISAALGAGTVTVTNARIWAERAY